MAARKARAEGAVAKPVASDVAPALADITKHPDPVPGDDGDALDRIAESFRVRFGDDWENIRLCPLQHGLVAMADLLRSR